MMIREWLLRGLSMNEWEMKWFSAKVKVNEDNPRVTTTSIFRIERYMLYLLHTPFRLMIWLFMRYHITQRQKDTTPTNNLIPYLFLLYVSCTGHSNFIIGSMMEIGSREFYSHLDMIKMTHRNQTKPWLRIYST